MLLVLGALIREALYLIKRDGLWLVFWHIIPARVRRGQKLAAGAMRVVLDLDGQLPEGQGYPGQLVTLADLDQGSTVRALWPVVM